MEYNKVLADEHLSHIDTIDYSTDGGLIVGLSSLTKRLWTGELLYFNACTKDTALSEHQAGLLLDCGLSDVKWIGASLRFIAACDSGAVELFELSEEKQCIGSIVKAAQHDDIVSSVSVNATATKFVSASYDRTVTVWDVEEFLPVTVYKAHYDSVWSTAFHSSNPELFASCSQDGRVLVWDMRQPKPASVTETEFLPSLPTCVTWQRDADHKLAVGTETGHLLLQDCRVGVGIPDILHVHTRPVHRIAFAPHRGDWLGSCSQDCTSAVSRFSQLADAGGDTCAASVVWRNTGQTDFVQGLCWNPVTNQLATCSWDGTVVCRDVNTSNDLHQSLSTDNGSAAAPVEMTGH